MSSFPFHFDVYPSDRNWVILTNIIFAPGFNSNAKTHLKCDPRSRADKSGRSWICLLGMCEGSTSKVTPSADAISLLLHPEPRKPRSASRTQWFIKFKGFVRCHKQSHLWTSQKTKLMRKNRITCETSFSFRKRFIFDELQFSDDEYSTLIGKWISPT